MTYENFTREELIQMLSEDDGGVKYDSSHFTSANKTLHTVQKKGGIGVNFRISKGEDVESKEGTTHAPKGHVIVTRPGVKGDKPDTYHMPAEKFKQLHHDVDHDKGTATQSGVKKQAIIAHADGTFHPDWSDKPMQVKKGDILVNNGGPHVEGKPHNDVAAIGPSEFKQTYNKVEENFKSQEYDEMLNEATEKGKPKMTTENFTREELIEMLSEARQKPGKWSEVKSGLKQLVGRGSENHEMRARAYYNNDEAESMEEARDIAEPHRIAASHPDTHKQGFTIIHGENDTAIADIHHNKGKWTVKQQDDDWGTSSSKTFDNHHEMLRHVGKIMEDQGKGEAEAWGVKEAKYHEAAHRAGEHDRSSYAETSMAGAGWGKKGAELHTAAAKAAKEAGAHKDVVNYHLAKAAAHKKEDVDKLTALDEAHANKGLLSADEDGNIKHSLG